MVGWAIALIVIGVLLVGFLISHFCVIYYIFTRFFGRFKPEYLDERLKLDHNYDNYRQDMFDIRSELENMKHEIVTINSQEGFPLKGYFYDQNSKDTIIFFHGVHVNALNTFSLHAKKCLNEGFNVLIVDQRAHGLSGGKYISYGKYEQDDVLRWVNYIEQKEYVENIYLYGSSMGGTSICLASDKITSKKVKVLVVDCAFTTIRKLVNHITSSKNIPGKLFLPGVEFYAKHLVKTGFDDFDTTESLKLNKIPTLFIQGTKDVVVTEQFLMDNYNACASFKEELLVKDATHTLALNAGGDEAFNKLFNFLKENR